MASKRTDQTLIHSASGKITASYAPVLHAAQNAAWDFQVPTQTVVDGLTARVQKQSSEIRAALAEELAAQEIMLRAMGKELAATAQRFNIVTPENTPENTSSGRVSWSELRQQYQDEGG